MKNTTKHNNYGNVVFLQNYQSITYKTLFCISHFPETKRNKWCRMYYDYITIVLKTIRFQ
jgi:hypothetical protein